MGVYAVRARLLESTSLRVDESTSEAGHADRLVDSPTGRPVDFVPPKLGHPLPGAANLGLNPTFREGAQAGSRREPLLLEVHLFDVDEDLYGRLLRVEFVHRLRDERRFPNVEALKIQIGKDVQAARRLLAG